MSINTMRLRSAFIFACLLSILFFSCQKESPGDMNIPQGQSRLSIYMTDGPTDYDNVFIDIQQIAVKLDTCRRNGDDDHDQPGCDEDHDQHNSNCEIWDTLAIRPGIYDLLTLRNGVDTLLASGFILNGKIQRIKFTLGDNNSVVVDSVSRPLKLVNSQNYIYVNIRREHLDSLSSNDFQLYLDFDLRRSIAYRNGQYWLRPVLTPFSIRSTGEIEGRIAPRGSFGVVKAFNETDSAFALPWQDGKFKVRGLREGTYSLFIDGINGHADKVIPGFVVQRHRDTNAGTITMQ